MNESPSSGVGRADVLGVPVSELTAGPSAGLRRFRVGHEAARAVRLALSGCGFASGATAPVDLNVLRNRVCRAWDLVQMARYRELGELPPGLIEDCEHAARKTADERRTDGSRLLAELYQAVAAMMAKPGEADAAWVATDRSAFAAGQAGDPVLEAAAGFRLGHAFLTRATLSRSSGR